MIWRRHSGDCCIAMRISRPGPQRVNFTHGSRDLPTGKVTPFSDMSFGRPAGSCTGRSTAGNYASSGGLPERHSRRGRT